jgi:hypothetical protein
VGGLPLVSPRISRLVRNFPLEESSSSKTLHGFLPPEFSLEANLLVERGLQCGSYRVHGNWGVSI